MSGLINFEDEKEVKQYLDNIGVEFSYQCYREKDPEGCQRLADYMEGVKKNFESTAQVLKHNCETNKHGESCYKLGAYYIQGKGGFAENLKMAYSCFMMACSSGGKKSVDACHNVGLLAHDGRAMEAGPDPGAARQYYEKDEKKAEELKNRAKELHFQEKERQLKFGE